MWLIFCSFKVYYLKIKTIKFDTFTLINIQWWTYEREIYKVEKVKYPYGWKLIKSSDF